MPKDYREEVKHHKLVKKTKEKALKMIVTLILRVNRINHREIAKKKQASCNKDLILRLIMINNRVLVKQLNSR